MSYNGSGVFNINTSGQPVVTGTVISSTAFNALTADLATGLTTALTKDGQTTPTANIPMGGFKITGIAAATTLGDALSYGRAATVSALTSSALTSGRVTYASTAGLLTDSANFVFDGTNLGIGGSPSGKLWVSGAQNANDIYINNSTTSTQLRMQMVDAQASIFTTGSYPLTFGTNNTNNRMVIDTSGNLLVGNSTDPLGSNRLLVQSASTAANNRTMSVYNSAASSTTAFANRLLQLSSSGSGADVSIHFSDQVANNAYIGMGSGALYFAIGSGTTKNMTLDSSGNLLVGTTTVLQNMHSFVGSNSTGGQLGVRHSSNTAGKLYAIGNTSDATPYFIIENQDGVGVYLNPSGTSWNATSDVRLKENIAPLENSLANIMSLNPVRFTFKKDGRADVGFIAQEMYQYIPDAVDKPENEERMMGISKERIIPFLVKAMQELKAEVDALKSQLNQGT